MYEDVLIRKPWGTEYIAYSCPEFMVTMLHIVPGRGTSLHKHERKDTELIVLTKGIRIDAQGSVRRDMEPGFRFEIKAGRPHKTNCIAPIGKPMSEDGAWVMEIERPPDKEDLIRLEDEYDRGPDYEGEENWVQHPANLLSLTSQKQRFLDWDIWIEDGDVKLERIKAMRVSDYIFKRIAGEGITHVFGVVGGGAMHLSDSVGNTDGITFVPCHHEQAATMAAEAYARYTNKPGVVLVTSGPGGTNAITGVCGAWIDSIPLIIISGQVTRDTMIGDSGVRQMGIQETNIVDVVKPMTKYAITLQEPRDVFLVMNHAVWACSEGRPGPVLVDVPLDVQGAMVEVSP